MGKFSLSVKKVMPGSSLPADHNCRAKIVFVPVVQEEVVREAEATQSLLSDDGVHTASMLQKSEDISTDLNIRLLTAALRQRPSSAADNADTPGRPLSA